MTRTKKLCCVIKLMYWKLPFMERPYKQWKRLSEVEVSYEFVDAVAMRLVQWPNSMMS
jgi:3-isopropylmalate dehydrogenase